MKQYDLDTLRRMQDQIAAKVILEDRFKKPLKTITGFDSAFYDDEAVVAAVTVDYDTYEVMERKAIRERVSFPYIPTFLGFREAPLILKNIKRLKIEPDVLMLDSHGISHPLFCGCASHVGVTINKPTIGVAKKRLCGEYSHKPDLEKWVPLNYLRRTVGAVLLSKAQCNPIFISAGHMITLETAIMIVKHFILGYKIPEPIRLAHNYATKIKKELS